MIKILQENTNKTKRNDPYYELKFNYLIGDANGSTNEKVKVSFENPFVERFVTLINSLKPVSGQWGLILNGETLEKAFKEDQLTRDDFNFLNYLMFEDCEEGFEFPSNEEKYTFEFCEGVRGETEYSFLVFQGVDLKYVDEFGKKFETIIE